MLQTQGNIPGGLGGSDGDALTKILFVGRPRVESRISGRVTPASRVITGSTCCLPAGMVEVSCWGTSPIQPFA